MPKVARCHKIRKTCLWRFWVPLFLSDIVFLLPITNIFSRTSKFESPFQRKKRESECGGFDCMNGGFELLNGGFWMIIGGKKRPFFTPKAPFLHKYTPQNADFSICQVHNIPLSKPPLCLFRSRRTRRAPPSFAPLHPSAPPTFFYVKYLPIFIPLLSASFCFGLRRNGKNSIRYH